jgi:two-component system, chemotaxis family, sensor kinase CheA
MSGSLGEGGVEGWNRFVSAAAHDVRALDDGISTLEKNLTPKLLSALGQAAFRVGLSSLLVGAEEVGRLALSIERALDLVALGELSAADAASVLTAPREALSGALAQLENPDRSGARVEGLPLVELREALDAALPTSNAKGSKSAPSKSSTSQTDSSKSSLSATESPKPTSSPALAAESKGIAAFVWSPAVDEDMVELFFDEARERIEGISGKLIELERNASDPELLRDLFRDLHTVKGSSAMVGLEPVNRLAHASEDLVGQLREGARSVDAPVVNALLATLDALREMLESAHARRPITTDPTALLRVLRDPNAASATVPSTALVSKPTSPSITESAQKQAETQPGAPGPQRQTIRVDFDKLDRLLNLVGELVLGREGVRNAHTALASVMGELSSDRALARRITHVRERHISSDSLGRVERHQRTSSTDSRHAMKELADELGRVERVLGSIASDLDSSTGRIHSISNELREQVTRLRMISIGGVFRKHQRTVRDLAQSLQKKVRLEIVGEDTELDKLLVDALDEPLMHLVRNAVDHGVETTAEREASGKSPESTVRLEASHRGNQVLITISDDGRGMSPERLKQKARDKRIATDAELDAMDDRAALELIFRPGFSTAASVSDVSGRGVGMDVVRQTIVTRLKGTIDIESTLGEGSVFILRLPLTLAIIQVLLARASGETFAIPLDSVERTIVVEHSDVRLVGDREIIEVDGETVPLVRLSHVLELDGQDMDAEETLHIVLTAENDAPYALACDRLISKKEIVIKSLGDLLAGAPCVSGATLLGDRCALILDVPAVIQRALRRPRGIAPSQKRALAKASRKGRVLLVEDSDTVREALRRLLVEAGYDVTIAEDGRIGLELCKEQLFDIVSTDVMMPHMDGYELTRALRALPTYRDVPIVMVTSRGELIDRVRGFDAGVDDYITKPHDRQLLLRAIERLLGHDALPAVSPAVSPAVAPERPVKS